MPLRAGLSGLRLTFASLLHSAACSKDLLITLYEYVLTTLGEQGHAREPAGDRCRAGG